MAVDTGAAAAASRYLAQMSRHADRLSRYMVWAGGALILAAAAVVTFDVLQRKVSAVTGLSFSGSDEISGYLFAIGTSWAFSYTVLRRANVRVDALYLLLPRRARAFLDVVGIVVLSLFVVVVTWHALQLLIHNTTNWSKSITPLLTPLAIPQFFWMVGLLAFVFNLLLVTLRAVLALLTGDLLTVGTIAGARTHEEEFEEEMRALHLEAAAGAAQAPETDASKER